MAKKQSPKKKSHSFDVGIKTDWLLTLKDGSVQPLRNYFVGIRQEKIVAVRPVKKTDAKSCRQWIEKENSVLIPGLINAHTHLAMTLFRGVEDDVPLKTWLFDRILPLEASLVNAEFVKTGSELAARECLRFGTTTVNDMYFFPGETAKVWDHVGLRGVFAQCLASFPIPEDRFLGEDRFARFHALRERYQDHSRIQISLAPHAPYSCNNQLLSAVAEVRKKQDCLLHIHVSEASNEVPDSLRKYQKNPVERLKSLGVLSEKTVAAHSVHLNESDIEIYRQTGTSPIYNPDSNTKLASGTAPIRAYLQAKIPVALGTDGSASANDLSLFGAMDVGCKIQKLVNQNATAMTAAEALRMATLDGARALSLDHLIGSIEVGKLADLVLVDLNFPHLQPVHDVTSQLVYAAQGLEVDTVLCHGRVLLKNKQFTDVKLRKLPIGLEKARQQVQRELKKLRAKADTHVDTSND